MWAMAVKEFRQLRRDHRTVAMMIVLPVVLLVVFGYAASFDVTSIRTIVMGPAASQVATVLPTRFDVREVVPGGDRDQAIDRLRRGEATVVVLAGPVPAILVDGADLFAARAVVAAAALQPSLPTPEVLFNPELKTSTVMVPAIIGMILVFVGTVATSLGVVRERQAGTLEQLAVMPFRAARRVRRQDRPVLPHRPRRHDGHRDRRAGRLRRAVQRVAARRSPWAPSCSCSSRSASGSSSRRSARTRARRSSSRS